MFSWITLKCLLFWLFVSPTHWIGSTETNSTDDKNSGNRDVMDNRWRSWIRPVSTLAICMVRRTLILPFLVAFWTSGVPHTDHQCDDEFTFLILGNVRHHVKGTLALARNEVESKSEIRYDLVASIESNQGVLLYKVGLTQKTTVRVSKGEEPN